VRATNSVGPSDFTIPVIVAFSGPVQQLNAVRLANIGGITADWQAPVDNVVPVVSYKVTQYYRFRGSRHRVSTSILPATSTSTGLALSIGCCKSYYATSITPIDALGRLGAQALITSYGSLPSIPGPPAPTPTNSAPVANAGVDKAITLPHTVVALAGSATDDGLPAPAKLSYQWSVASGPAAVNFGNPNQAASTAIFSVAGSYTLRLTVSDGALSHQDDMIVTVSPAPAPVNAAPTANAGQNQTITLPASSVTLNGSATDDGLPTPTQLSYQWSVVSGPGNVVFGSPASASTTASFGTAGSYTLQLTVSDGALTGSSTVAVVVKPQAPAQTTPPAYNPNGQKVELSGTIQETGASYIVASGVKIWYTSSTVLKFEDGTGGRFQVGQNVQLKASRNSDGTVTAGKIQAAP